MGETDVGDWYADCSDDEKYNPTGSDDPLLWQPEHHDILHLYEKIAKGEKLELEWKCPGRRSPSLERKHEEMEVEEEIGSKSEEEEKLEPTEFDFDDLGADPNPTTPIRTPGATKTPRSMQKRVARLDKILNDISRHKKINKAKSRAHSQSTPVRPKTNTTDSSSVKSSKTVATPTREYDSHISSRPSTPKSSHGGSPRTCKNVAESEQIEGEGVVVSAVMTAETKDVVKPD